MIHHKAHKDFSQRTQILTDFFVNLVYAFVIFVAGNKQESFRLNIFLFCSIFFYYL